MVQQVPASFSTRSSRPPSSPSHHNRASAAALHVPSLTCAYANAHTLFLIHLRPLILLLLLLLLQLLLPPPPLPTSPALSPPTPPPPPPPPPHHHHHYHYPHPTFPVTAASVQAFVGKLEGHATIKLAPAVLAELRNISPETYTGAREGV